MSSRSAGQPVSRPVSECAVVAFLARRPGNSSDEGRGGSFVVPFEVLRCPAGQSAGRSRRGGKLLFRLAFFSLYVHS